MSVVDELQNRSTQNASGYVRVDDNGRVQIGNNYITHNYAEPKPDVYPTRPPVRLIPFDQNEDVVDRDIFAQLEALLPPSRNYQSAALWGLGGSG
jgi:hypothetical protein